MLTKCCTHAWYTNNLVNRIIIFSHFKPLFVYIWVYFQHGGRGSMLSSITSLHLVVYNDKRLSLKRRSCWGADYYYCRLERTAEGKYAAMAVGR